MLVQLSIWIHHKLWVKLRNISTAWPLDFAGLLLLRTTPPSNYSVTNTKTNYSVVWARSGRTEIRNAGRWATVENRNSIILLNVRRKRLFLTAYTTGLTTEARQTVSINISCTWSGIVVPKTTTMPATAVGNQQIPNKQITTKSVFAICTSSPTSLRGPRFPLLRSVFSLFSWLFLICLLCCRTVRYIPT